MSRWLLACVLLFALCGFFTAAAASAQSFALGSAVAIVLLALPSCVVCYRWIGTRALLVIAALGVYALCVETVGVLTGFPYGSFSYSALLGVPLGVVPWTVLFAWTPLVFGACVLASRVATHWLARATLAALILSCFDMVLDPGAVHAGFWSYAQQQFYGVPWTNFAGWLLTGFGGALLFAWLTAHRTPPVLLLLSATLSVVFWSAYALTAGLLAPGILGCVLSAWCVWVLYEN